MALLFGAKGKSPAIVPASSSSAIPLGARLPGKRVQQPSSASERKRGTMTNYRDRHIVVSGGTGALGVAVVTALLEAGAICHVPYRSEAEVARLQGRDPSRV